MISEYIKIENFFSDGVPSNLRLALTSYTNIFPLSKQIQCVKEAC